MLREGIRLSTRHQALMYGAFGVLLVTGALWLVFHTFIRVSGELGDVAHPLENWWLRLHGAGAMAFLVVLGSLVRGHIRVGWKTRQNRGSGVGLLLVNIILIVTGWALYYVGSDEWRGRIGVGHWGVGLGAAVIMFAHVSLGRLTRLRRMHSRLDAEAVR